MARILVVGSINIDRVHFLAAPLRTGARLAYSRVEIRYGGGAFFTGVTLLGLGHQVRLLTRLAGDEGGRRCRAMLERSGFDTSLVETSEPATHPFDILVDPSGERTILFSAAAKRAPFFAIPAGDADLVYLNVRRANAAALEGLLPRHRVVAQYPLEPGERRPAHVLLASHSDVAAAEPAALFAAARLRAGASLEALVLTSGPDPVRIVDATGETREKVPTCSACADTIGAGDVFAAGFVDGYVRGRPLAEVVRRGSEIAVRFLADRPERPRAVAI